MGDWKTFKGPVNIQTWTPLARNMAKMSKKQKKFEIEKWDTLQPKLKEARGKRGVNEIPEAKATEFLKTVSNLRTKLSVPVAPAMPLVQSILALNLEDKGQPESRRC